MDKVTIIGVDLAKCVFQVHGCTTDGKAVFRKKLTRGQFEAFMAAQPRCVVAMEASSTAHHWGRTLKALGFEVRLLPPIHVKPFVKRQKNDANDAEAITEAARRPGLHWVAIKSKEEQALAMLLRTRDQLISQRTATINALRSHLAEFGLVVPQGTKHLPELAQKMKSADLPALVHDLADLHRKHIAALEKRIAGLNTSIEGHNRKSDTARLLTTMPGIGPIGAITIEAFACDLKQFGQGREFAAWLGLVPRQHSSGGKARLGRCSKMGQRDIRRLLIIGAMSVIAGSRRKGRCDNLWLADKLARKPRMVAAIALANKMARQIWAMVTKNEVYAPSLPEAA